MSKWIEFSEEAQPPKRKTKSWAVRAKGGDIKLGAVKWYGPWRQYSFFPVADTLYEKQCLRDIADFCERETKWQRLEKKGAL